VVKLVGDVPAGGWERNFELVGREGAVFASQTKEGDGGECWEKAEVNRGAVQVLGWSGHLGSGILEKPCYKGWTSGMRRGFMTG